jgi:hypothetical protein
MGVAAIFQGRRPHYRTSPEELISYVRILGIDNVFALRWW